MTAYVVFRISKKDNSVYILRVCWQVSNALAAVKLLRKQYPEYEFLFQECEIDEIPLDNRPQIPDN